MDIRDSRNTKVHDGDYELVKNDDLAFEPIAGITFPPLPSGPGPHGVMLGADFSYSTHDLLVESRKVNVATFKRCKRARRTPRVHGKKITCPRRSR
jgi:hypothetical protein